MIFFSFFHLLSTCMTPLSIFNILIALHRLLETPDNLELRNIERRGVARLSFNDVSLAGLMGNVDVGHFGEVFGKTCERISEETLRYCHATLGLLESEERNFSYFVWSNSITSHSTVFPMKLILPCATTCSLVEKVVPSGVAISFSGLKIKNMYCKIFSNQ